MSNLRPIKMWINGKVFPIQILNKARNLAKEKNKNYDNVMMQDDDEPATATFSDEESRILDIKEENEKLHTYIKVPPLYYTKLKNYVQVDIDKVSEQTNTQILIPKIGNAESGISVSGNNRVDLFKAVDHIHSALAAIRQQNIALQFICIPCVHSNIQERFQNLKNELLGMKGEISGMHDSIFMCPLKLHITVDVYVLLDDREKAEAINALNDYKDTLDQLHLETGPWKLDIGTLACMNNNEKKVDVVYANVKLVNETSEHCLQKIINGLSHHFYHRGLARSYQKNVKLHMTIINTKYRKTGDSPKRKSRRQSIDATKLMEKFQDYSFGHCDFSSVHLSHISLKNEDGFYKTIAEIKFNDKNKSL